MSISVKKKYGGIDRVFFKGVELDQHANILVSFPLLFKKLNGEGNFVERIIEIGSSRGGLPFVLNEISMVSVKIVSYDIQPAYMASAYAALAKENGIEFRVANCFKVENEIADLIQQPGLTILLCDGGNKIKEFNTFAKYLKSGDIIMVHDYGETIEHYKRDIADKNIWKMEWLSSRGDQIQETCDKYVLEPFMQDEFIESVWGIRRKR